MYGAVERQLQLLANDPDWLLGLRLDAVTGGRTGFTRPVVVIVVIVVPVVVSPAVVGAPVG